MPETGKLGERALADAEHLITRLEARYFTADCNHHTGHVETGNCVLRRTQADHQTRGIRHTGHQMPSAPVEAGGTNLYEHLVGPDHRPLDLGHTEHICRAVLRLDDRTHQMGSFQLLGHT